jgi:hypothetical protein
MLPDALFKPLSLQHLIEETERAYGARGVVDLLVKALTDRRVRCDTDIDVYLDRLKVACRQTRRYAEIIPVLKRIAQLKPARKAEMAAETALVHGHLKSRAAGVTVLQAAFAEQLRRPARRRSAEFCVVGEIAAAVLGRPDLARDIAAMGRAVSPDAMSPDAVIPDAVIPGALAPARSSKAGPARVEPVVPPFALEPPFVLDELFVLEDLLEPVEASGPLEQLVGARAPRRTRRGAPRLALVHSEAA